MDQVNSADTKSEKENARLMVLIGLLMPSPADQSN